MLPDGKEINFIAITQSFSKHAPILTEFVTAVSRSFVILVEGNGPSLRIRSAGPSDEVSLHLSSYFVQSEETFAINLVDGKIIKLDGYQSGGAGRDPDGKIVVELNLEGDTTFGDLIHELIHVKIPEMIPQAKMPHGQFDMIASQILKRLKISAKHSIFEEKELAKEKGKIIEVFNQFNENLRDANLF